MLRSNVKLLLWFKDVDLCMAYLLLIFELLITIVSIRGFHN